MLYPGNDIASSTLHGNATETLQNVEDALRSERTVFGPG